VVQKFAVFAHSLMKLKFLIPIYACAILMLGACKHSDKPVPSVDKPVAVSQTVPPAISSTPTATYEAEMQWLHKAEGFRNIYQVLGFRLLNSVSKWDKGRDYLEGIEKMPNEFIDSFDQSISENLALPGDMPKMDAAARHLQEVTRKYVPNWKALADYNKFEGYKKDNGAKGVNMLAMYREGVEEITQARPVVV